MKTREGVVGKVDSLWNQLCEQFTSGRSEGEPVGAAVLAGKAVEQAPLHQALCEHGDCGSLDEEVVGEFGRSDTALPSLLPDGKQQAELGLGYTRGGEVLVEAGGHAGAEPHQGSAQSSIEQVGFIHTVRTLTVRALTCVKES